MGKYTSDAKELLHLVGGRENIAAVSHCITRMRFVLNDPKKADIQKIEAMKVVKGSFTQAGQFQVIIGNTVSDFYNDFIAVAGIEGVSKDAVKSAAKQNQNVVQRIMTALAEIFAPPAIMNGSRKHWPEMKDIRTIIFSKKEKRMAVHPQTGKVSSEEVHGNMCRKWMNTICIYSM